MQEWFVAIIVASAVWFVLKRYMPKAIKHTARMQIASIAQSLGWSTLAARFEPAAQTASTCSDGCGSCGGCGSTDLPRVEKKTVIMMKIARDTDVR